MHGHGSLAPCSPVQSNSRMFSIKKGSAYSGNRDPDHPDFFAGVCFGDVNIANVMGVRDREC